MEITRETVSGGGIVDARSRSLEAPVGSRAIGERFVAIWDCARLESRLAEVDALFSPAFVNHDPITGPSREDYKRELALYCQAFRDLVATPQHILADGDLVVVRWRASGTYAGGLEFLGIDDATAVGRTVTLKGIDLLRIERGAIAERWGEFDALGMIGQLNAMGPGPS